MRDASQLDAVRWGAPLERAAGVLVLVHGRGATAEGILGLAPALGATHLHVVAPQAVGNTWYPFSFLEPIPRNEPGISRGIARLETLVGEALAAGHGSDRIVIAGFSQGACLSLEFVARHPRRYGAVLGFSGGLIGPPGTPRDYPGTLAGTPVFLGCSDIDPHIPAERVRETATVLTTMGASVDMRLYPGMPHTVNDDEIAAGRALLAAIDRPRT